jgi:hypothetical protein
MRSVREPGEHLRTAQHWLLPDFLTFSHGISLEWVGVWGCRTHFEKNQNFLPENKWVGYDVGLIEQPLSNQACFV